MTDVLEVQQKMAERFRDGMAANLPTVMYGWANGKKIEDYKSPRVANWIRFFFRPSDQVQVAMGAGPLYRIFGFLDIQIFTPLGRGEGYGFTVCNTVRKFMTGTPMVGAYFPGSTIESVGESDGWWQHSLRLQFQADVLS